MRATNRIRASEIQAYSFCARNWWLQHVLELQPEDWGQLATGTDHHRVHGRRVVQAEGFRRVALLVLLAALVLAAFAVIWLLRGG